MLMPGVHLGDAHTHGVGVGPGHLRRLHKHPLQAVVGLWLGLRLGSSNSLTRTRLIGQQERGKGRGRLIGQQERGKGRTRLIGQQEREEGRVRVKGRIGWGVFLL